MRTTIVSALLSLALLSPAAARAQEPSREPALFELKVGEVKPMPGFRPLCDDPSVAAFLEDGSGKLTGLSPGETLCSVSVGSPLGLRLVYRVVVTPAPPGRGKSRR